MRTIYYEVGDKKTYSWLEATNLSDTLNKEIVTKFEPYISSPNDENFRKDHIAKVKAVIKAHKKQGNQL